MPALPARRPLDPACRRRLARRAAAGLDPKRLVRAEGGSAAEVRALLADPAFRALVAAYRELRAKSREEQLRRLAEIADMVLEEALLAGDVRAAIFVRASLQRGLDPARVLAEGVVAARERRPRTTPPSPRPRPQRQPADPLDRLRWRAAARLRAAVRAENAVRRVLRRVAAGIAASTPSSAPPVRARMAGHPSQLPRAP